MAKKKKPEEKEDKELVRKIDQLYEACRKNAEEIFGLDEYGDLKVNIRLIDRRKYWPLHYFDIPYDHKAKTSAELFRIFELLVANLGMAQNEIDKFLKIYRDKVTIAMGTWNDCYNNPDEEEED